MPSETRLRILLIENDAPVVRLAAWALTTEGFDVQIVSAREALELRGLDGPDAAIFNMSATAEDKQAYNKHLRLLCPNCVIIDVDEHATIGQSIRDSDADVYRLRPLTLDDLARSIRNICALTIEQRRGARDDARPPARRQSPPRFSEPP